MEHFPEKWAPVFRKKMRQIKNPERFPIHLKPKALYDRRVIPVAISADSLRRHGRLDPAIHDFDLFGLKDVDARLKAGHDG
jgi:hypothetical protein